MTRPPTRPAAPRRRRRRLAFDRLERRSLLSMAIVVGTEADTVDPTDGALSLREAIELSNGQLALTDLGAAEQAAVTVTPNPPPRPGSPPVPNTIEFNIPGTGNHVITVTGSPLPAITAPVTIDGYTQPGSSVSPPEVTEADVNAPTVRLDGSSLGTGPLGEGFDGLAVATSNCQVDGLIVTGFSGFGMTITGATSQGNWLLGNFVGCLPDPANGRYFVADPKASPGLSNRYGGIKITASNNRVGGNTPGLPNVVANNGYDAAGDPAGGVGILIDTPGGTGNLIQGNGIFHNAAQGVYVRSSNNTIGEAIAGGGNSIGYNGADGVLITGGPAVQGNGLLGNYIGCSFGTPDGTVKKGQTPFPNHGNGVLILGSPRNYLGGAADAARNVIGSNDLDGVAVEGAEAADNRLVNNWIGFNIVNNQIVYLPNQNGVYDAAPGTQIGDAVAGVGNAINNNRLHGVLVAGSLTSGTVIAANIIGLNPGGGSAFPNAFDGVHLDNAPNVTVGGTTTAARNTISANNNGVYVAGTGSTGVVIAGNFIGTAVDGVTDLGNAVNGVVLDNAPNNLVGGTAAGAGNVISGNNRGVVITGPSATRNDVQGNFIGTDLTARAVIHNEVDGVLVTAGASDNTIGGPDPGQGNTIAYNAGAGVRLDDGVGNAVLSNAIYTNTGHGIVLNPATSADRLQPAPTLTAATPSGNATHVQGTLDAAGGTTYTLQFFSSAAKDPSGFGQGEVYLATATVTTDSTGHAVIDLNVPVAVASGRFLTATATSPEGDTSAFSNAIPAVPVGFALGAAAYTVGEAGGSAVISVTRLVGSPGAPSDFGGTVAVGFTVGGGTATPGTDYTPVSGTLYFHPGDPATKTFVVPILDPHKVGGSVWTTVRLVGPTNGAALAAPSSATLTILDNDIPTLRLGATPGPVRGAGTAVFTVVRDSPVGTSTVDYTTANGTAVAGVNYTRVAGTLVFRPGETSKTVAVPVLDDAQVHPTPLTFRLLLSHPTGGLLGSANAGVGTVVADNSPGALGFATSFVATAPGASSVALTVVRTGGRTGAVTVAYASGGGTARPGVDYVPVAGTLTFGPGVTSRTITVPLRGTSLPGSPVNFALALARPGGGSTLGRPIGAAVTIVHPGSAPGAFGYGPSAAPAPPTVTAVVPVAGPQGVYALVVGFSKAMDPSRAQDPVNYGTVVLGPSGGDRITAALYDPASHQTVLLLASPVPAGSALRVVFNANPTGAAGVGLTDAGGTPLDGTGTGLRPGTVYAATVPAGPRASAARVTGGVAARAKPAGAR